MEIVINIPEKVYSYVNTQWRDIPKNDSPISIMCNAVIDGTPLPKGHGRLIDADMLEKKVEKHRKMLKISEYDRDLVLHYTDIEMAPTIIDSDKEG